MYEHEIVPPGVTTSNAREGDLIFCHRKGFVSFLIRLGESLRGEHRWSHVAYVREQYGIIEALTHGVTKSDLNKYKDIEYVLVHTGLDEVDKVQASAFVESCLGQKYGFLVILGIILRYLTPGKGLWFGMNGTEICSGLCAQAMCRGWANFPKDNPASITPSRVAKYYGV